MDRARHLGPDREDIVAAVLCHRLVVLIGVSLIVWATPRLARRCDVAEVSALWLGAANPLLLMHLVAGIHNEALMLGLMLTGAVRAARCRLPAVDADVVANRPGLGAAGHVAGRVDPDRAVVAGEAALVLALGFVTAALAYRLGGTVRALLLVGAGMAGLSVAVMALVGWASGLGFGWIYTLGTANVVRSWMSPPTLLALGTGRSGFCSAWAITPPRCWR